MAKRERCLREPESIYSLLFLHSRECTHFLMCKTLRLAILTDLKRREGWRLRRAGKLHYECAVVPMFQRRGIFCRTAFDLERSSIEQDFAASVIVIFVNADEGLRVPTNFPGLVGAGGGATSFAICASNFQDRFLVRLRGPCRIADSGMRAYSFGERREIEIRCDEDARVRVRHERDDRSHPGERPGFFDHLAPRVVVAVHAQAIVEAGRLADRRQLGEAQLADHASLEHLCDRLGLQDAFAVCVPLSNRSRTNFAMSDAVEVPELAAPVVSRIVGSTTCSLPPINACAALRLYPGALSPRFQTASSPMA